MGYIIAVDQGTTSTRSIVFDDQFAIVGQGQEEFEQHFPNSGWVEHNPKDLLATVISTCKKALNDAKIKANEILALGITNQRETTLLWDKVTGNPIYNAIVWQDRRTARDCDRLKAAGHAQAIRRKTGLVIDAYFSATKIAWLLKHVKGARALARQGRLAFGTIDTWLIWKLTGGTVHVTDASNASRTMLYNLHTGDWDAELLKLFKVPRSVLPEVRGSSEVLSETNLLGGRIPIAGIAGDQQAALFGQCCTRPGMVKNTYGTGCFMLMQTGPKPIVSKNNLLSTVAWRIGSRTEFALEGSIL